VGGDCLRVGRVAVERWSPTATGLSLLASHALQADVPAQLDSLATAIKLLCEDKPKGGVNLLLESACLPVLLVDTGGLLWSSGQVKALAQHQFESLYGDDTRAWELRVEHALGTRFALAYGLPHRLQQRLLDTLGQIGVACDAVLPAFAWGWHRLRPERHWPRRTGWWAWPEQDRLLLARIQAGRIVALNAGLEATDNTEEIVRHADAECVRLGLDSPLSPVGVASWKAPQNLSLDNPRATWLPLGDAASPSRPSFVAQPQGGSSS